MTIASKETKTFYNIRFTSSEFAAIAQHYLNSTDKHKYPRAFENNELTEDIKITVLDEFFKEMGITGNGDLFRLIAEYFGFDGWQNAGYYNRNKNCYCMTVYDYGDTLNK